ncbi:MULTISPECIES: hypothetical protein [unclassified Streptomyces]|nr:MULTISPECIES: hypothetical protein [unclassified Streptomyces]
MDSAGQRNGFLPGVAALLNWWPDSVNWAGAKGRELLSQGGAGL